MTADHQGSDFVDLRPNDFRATPRRYLAPHVFALPGPEPPLDPPELVSEETWANLVHLADDVALETTSLQGQAVDRIHRVGYQWLLASPVEPQGTTYSREPALLATEEFDALAFIAVHGWYRQALGCLRNALEIMTHAAAFASGRDLHGFRRWRRAEVEPKFQASRNAIRKSAWGAELETQVAPPLGAR